MTNKIKSFVGSSRELMEERVNNFIRDKKVIDIKLNISRRGRGSILVIYENQNEQSE